MKTTQLQLKRDTACEDVHSAIEGTTDYTITGNTPSIQTLIQATPSLQMVFFFIRANIMSPKMTPPSLTSSSKFTTIQMVDISVETRQPNCCQDPSPGQAMSSISVETLRRATPVNVASLRVIGLVDH